MKLPYMRWFPADYLAATAHLSVVEDGVYRRLLDLMWMEGGELPSDEEWLRRRLRLSVQEWQECWPAVRELVDDDGVTITQKRLRREAQRASDLSNKNSENGRRSAELRRQRSAELRTSNDRSTIVQRSSNDRSTNQNQKLEPEPEPDRSSSIDRGGRGTPGGCGEAGSDRAVESVVSETAENVMAYWNSLSGGRYLAHGTDGAHLRERIAEMLRDGDQAPAVESACEHVVEAATASGVDHPRRAFSQQRFGDLLALRRNPARWEPIEDRLFNAPGVVTASESGEEPTTEGVT